MKKIALALVVCLVVGIMAGCTSGFMSEIEMLNVTQNPEVSITLSYTDAESVEKSFTMVFELHYDKAPITVTNFVNLVQEGFYDNTIIHTCNVSKVSTSDIYYIAGGKYELDSEADQTSSKKSLIASTKDYHIKGEFESNGWTENDLKHLVGALVMDRDSGVSGFDSANTGYYICMNDYNKRDGNYAVFGTLKSMSGKIGDREIPSQDSLISTFRDDMIGMSNTSTATDADGNSVKIPNLTIVVTMTVNTFGVTYPTAKHV